MPAYGSLGSPSLRKMENGGYGQRASGFSLGRIIGDPFALATISIGIVSIRQYAAVAAWTYWANMACSSPGSSPLSAL
jgi:hypothetical protein